MRINFRIIWLALPLVFGACSDSSDADTRPATETISVSVGSGPKIDIESEDRSRTQLGEDGVSVKWASDDQIALWAVNSRSETVFSKQAFKLYHYNTDYNTAKFRGDIPQMPADTYTYYAVSPVPSESDGTQATYLIPDVQDGGFNGDWDVMVADPVKAPALEKNDTGETVQFQFRHKVHVLKIRIPKNDLGEKVSEITLAFPQPVTGRMTVDAADPDVHLLLSLRQRRASISLDLSGDPLFKRLPPAATRAGEGAHVLRPDYAALVLAQVGWTALCERELTADDYENEALPTLIDASCAGGGLLLEAVNILTDRAPGAARERWGFEGWQLHDAVLWEQLLAEAREREAAARERQARIVAVDIDPAARKTAERMVKCAGYKRFVDFCAAKPATVLDHADAVAGAAVVADTTETPLSLMHDAMTLIGELRRAPELASAPVAALTRDGLLARALHAEPERSIAVMPNNEEAALEVWPSLDHAAAAFEAATSADAEAEVADANEANDEAADTPTPEPAATLDLGDGKPLPVLIPESKQFANRLRKNARLRRKWAKREGVSCYRVYDADLPDYSAAIDLYEGCSQTPGRWLVIAEYAAPKTIDPALAQARMLDILAIAPRILDVPAEHVHAKARMRSRGGSQYGKQDAGKGGSGERANIARRRLPLIEEGGLTFAVNFDDYLDVGIFLDHRVTRNLVREHAKQARRFLNLFAYTGTATCYAADGGVEETVTVDLSNTYLDWAERNMRQNGFVGPQHHFVRDDVLAWIRDQRQTRNRWDLIFVDPPTFSNSSKMGRRTWDVQRDHVELLAGVSRLLAQGGHAIFSCNLRGFRPETRKLARAGVVLEDITAQTIPEDFARNQKVHHCYIVRRLPIEDAMAEVGFSAEEIAERVEELRNPEARKPRAAAPAPTQAGNGKSNFAGKPSPAGKSKKKKFYASKPKGK